MKMVIKMRVEVFYDNGKMKGFTAPLIETELHPGNPNLLIISCYAHEEDNSDKGVSKENYGRLERIWEALTDVSKKMKKINAKPFRVGLVNMELATVVDLREVEEEL